MGNLLQCSPDHNPTAQALLQMIKIAINNNHQLLLANSDQKLLQSMIRNGEPKSSAKDGIEVRILFPQTTSSSKVIEKEVNLIVHTESTSSSNRGQTNISKGYIFFHNAYYYGDIVKEKANGYGILHLPIQLYQIQGLWSEGSFKKGTIYKLSPQQYGRQSQKCCDIHLLNGEDQAIVTTQLFIYKGSIKLKGSTSFQQLLTGQGEITYHNGNRYKGQLVNGLFQTRNQKEALYTYASGNLKSYKGFFKEGLREDRGILQLQQGGDHFNINMKFSKGMPVENGIIEVEDFMFYQLQVQRSKLKIKQRLN